MWPRLASDSPASGVCHTGITGVRNHTETRGLPCSLSSDFCVTVLNRCFSSLSYLLSFERILLLSHPIPPTQVPCRALSPCQSADQRSQDLARLTGTNKQCVSFCWCLRLLNVAEFEHCLGVSGFQESILGQEQVKKGSSLMQYLLHALQKVSLETRLFLTAFALSS